MPEEALILDGERSVSSFVSCLQYSTYPAHFIRLQSDFDPLLGGVFDVRIACTGG
jgi:hypothetical protein